MGLWDAITDAAGDFGDAVSDAAESVYDRVSTSSLGDAIAWAGESVDTATFGLASRAMNATDDYVFDTVEYVTAGAVDIDFDDGHFTVGAGFDGIAHVGASVGESGMTANGEVLLGASFDAGLTDAGITASGSAGIDWGPLPYAAGHVSVDADGDVVVNGELQGTIPTQYGLLSGEVAGGFNTTDEGWGAYVDAEGTLRTPTGLTFRGGIDASYEENAEGSYASVGVEGSVSMVGVGTVGGGVGYERLEHDGDVVEGFHAEAEVSGYGMSARAEADYVHSDIDGVEQGNWSTDAEFDGPDLSDVAQVAAQMAADEFGAGDVVGADATAFDDIPLDDFGEALTAAESIDASMDDLVQDLQ